MPFYAVEAINSESRKTGCMAGVLELKGIQRAKAAVADDAGIELAYWAMSNETPAHKHKLELYYAS